MKYATWVALGGACAGLMGCTAMDLPDAPRQLSFLSAAEDETLKTGDAARPGSLLEAARARSGIDPRLGFDGPSQPLQYVSGPGGAALAIGPIFGAPDEARAQLITAIADRFGAPVDEAAFRAADRRFQLSGNAIAASGQVRSSLIADWRLTDGDGALVGEFFEREAVTRRGGRDAWAQIPAEAIDALAERVAVRLVTHPAVANPPLAATGRGVIETADIEVVDMDAIEIETETTAIETPSGAQAAASVQAQEALDPALNSAAAAGQSSAEAAASAARTEAALTASANEALPETASIAAAAPADGPDPIMIRRVAGARGDGDQALAAAMAERMREIGAPITADETDNAYIVDAEVSQSDGGDRDLVKIHWRVYRGATYIGEVTQQNEVEKGALDGAWGRQAAFAALGARNGILRLIATDIETRGATALQASTN